MALTLELVLLFLVVLGVGLWGVITGIRQSRSAQRTPVAPQELSGLAQPYRGYLGEAVAIQGDIAAQAKMAPKSLKHELETLTLRLEHLVRRALPRAQHGSRLVAYLLELRPDEAQHGPTQAAANAVEQDLASFVATLRTLRGKVYQVMTDATTLASDQQLAQDLDDALIDISALEEAFGEIKLQA